MIVVPLVGTWIETLVCPLNFCRSVVVPLVGTWIETLRVVVYLLIVLTSFPSWERGLKQWHSDMQHPEY